MVACIIHEIVSVKRFGYMPTLPNQPIRNGALIPRMNNGGFPAPGLVMRLELSLIWRNWITWLISLAMLVIGALCAANNRHEPWSNWQQFLVIALVLTVILTFTTGNQINRDRERRLDGIVFSTPVNTPVYVLGKYLAALLSLLGLAGLSLLAALLMDYFYPWQIVNVPWGGQSFLSFAPGIYPALGPQPYLIGWLWLFLVPMLFGAAFIFACITLTRGQRIIAYIAVLLFWLILPFFAHDYIPDLLDITGNSFFFRYSSSGFSPAQQLLFPPNANQATRLTPQLAQRVVQLSLTDLPPHSWPSSFFWNRLLFLALSLVLLGLTIYGVHRIRHHA